MRVSQQNLIQNKIRRHQEIHIKKTFKLQKKKSCGEGN